MHWFCKIWTMDYSGAQCYYLYNCSALLVRLLLGTCQRSWDSWDGWDIWDRILRIPTQPQPLPSQAITTHPYRFLLKYQLFLTKNKYDIDEYKLPLCKWF